MTTVFYQTISVPLQKKGMEETKKRGGRREGAGRPPKEDSKVQISLKLDWDLNMAFSSVEFSESHNRGRYINDAIRRALERDGFIKSQKYKRKT